MRGRRVAVYRGDVIDHGCGLCWATCMLTSGRMGGKATLWLGRWNISAGYNTRWPEEKSLSGLSPPHLSLYQPALYFFSPRPYLPHSAWALEGLAAGHAYLDFLRKFSIASLPARGGGAEDLAATAKLGTACHLYALTDGAC